MSATHRRRSPLARISAADISIPLAAVVLGLIASLLTLDLNHRVTRETHVQRALEHIRLDSLQLQALEARLIVAHKVKGPDIRAAKRILDDLARHRDELADLHRAGGTVVAARTLSAAFRQLVPSYAEQDPSRMNPGMYLARYLPARLRLQQVASASDHAAERRVETVQKEVAIGHRRSKSGSAVAEP